MTEHAKIYFKHFGYQIPEDVFCEVCGQRATDCHHINGRGPDKNVISNLMALCRSCHELAHVSKMLVKKSRMQSIHDEYMKRHERTQ